MSRLPPRVIATYILYIHYDYRIVIPILRYKPALH